MSSRCQYGPVLDDPLILPNASTVRVKVPAAGALKTATRTALTQTPAWTVSLPAKLSHTLLHTRPGSGPAAGRSSRGPSPADVLERVIVERGVVGRRGPHGAVRGAGAGKGAPAGAP